MSSGTRGRGRESTDLQHLASTTASTNAIWTKIGVAPTAIPKLSYATFVPDSTTGIPDTELEKQFGAPFRSATRDAYAWMTPPTGKSHALLLSNWLTHDTDIDSDTPKFVDPGDRYLSLGEAPFGGTLALVKTRALAPDQEWTNPFLVVLGPTATPQMARSIGVKAVDLDLEENWIPVGTTISDTLYPLAASMDRASRSIDAAELPGRFNNNLNSTWVFLNGLKAVTAILCIDKPLGDEDQEAWGPLWHTDLQQLPYDNDIVAFAASAHTSTSDADIPVGTWGMAPILPLPVTHGLPIGFAMELSPATTLEDFRSELQQWGKQPLTTTTWLDTPYVRAWFRVMAQHQELAQHVYSWDQLEDSLAPILLSTTSTAASLSFRYIRDALTHRLFYDRLWGTKFTTKATVNKFKIFEQQALAILGTATEFGESTSTFSQPYLFSIIQPFTKQWNTTYELASVSNRDTLPAWVLEFATLELPKTASTTLPTLVRLAESAAGSPMKTNTPATATMSAAQRLMRHMGQNLQVVSGQPPPTPPPTSRHSKRKPAPATPDRASPTFSLSNGYEIRRKEVFSVADSPPKQVSTTKQSSTPGFFNPTARVGGKTFSLDSEEAAWFLPYTRSSATAFALIPSLSLLPRPSQQVLVPSTTTDGEKSRKKDNPQSYRFTREAFIQGSLPGATASLAFLGSTRVCVDCALRPAVETASLIKPSWLNLPARVGPTYIQQVLVGSLDSTVGWLSETLRRTSANSPFIHQVPHKFPADFWSRTATLPLVKGLRSFRLDDGVDTMTTTAPETFTFWHLLGSLPDNSTGLMPDHGLSGQHMCQLIANAIGLFSLMFSDIGTYTALPHLTPGQHDSPFTITSPFCGLLLRVIDHLRMPTVAVFAGSRIQLNLSIRSTK
jgi:hypothetical protein